MQGCHCRGKISGKGNFFQVREKSGNFIDGQGNLERTWKVGGGVKVLGKLPVLGRPTNLDYSWARAYCTCSRCGWGLFGHFFSHLSLLFFFSLSLGDGSI